MPISRDAREQARLAGPRVAGCVVNADAAAAVIGRLAGVGWVVAGLLHVHPLVTS